MKTIWIIAIMGSWYPGDGRYHNSYEECRTYAIMKFKELGREKYPSWWTCLEAQLPASDKRTIEERENAR